MKLQRNYNTLKDVITAENIETISETIALLETKFLIGYIGDPMLKTHKDLQRDIYNKHNYKYRMSDSYELAQQIALFLCNYIGRSVFDVHHIDKKGKTVTILMEAEREMSRYIHKKFKYAKTNASLETFTEEDLPTTEILEETEEEQYAAVDTIIASLDLTEIQTTTLNCRMNGMSYSQIGTIINRALCTAYDYIQTIRKKFEAMYR